MAMSKLELAVRVSLANPRAALAHIAQVQDEQTDAALRAMSDVELDFIREVVERINAKAFSGTPRNLTEDERQILNDLRARREAGEIPLDRRQRRTAESCWETLNCLRSFAGGNGLPQPAIDHGLNAYREQVARDLFATYGVAASAPGVPLSSWADDDRAVMLEIWDMVSTTPPVVVRRPAKPQPVSADRRARGYGVQDDGREGPDVQH
jgi:hypothetical protein